MLIPVLLFIVGLLCLIKGGDWFVDGATGIARRFHVPELLIGATVVSIGTTLPEVMVSTMSAVSGGQWNLWSKDVSGSHSSYLRDCGCGGYHPSGRQQRACTGFQYRCRGRETVKCDSYRREISASSGGSQSACFGLCGSLFCQPSAENNFCLPL